MSISQQIQKSKSPKVFVTGKREIPKTPKNLWKKTRKIRYHEPWTSVKFPASDLWARHYNLRSRPPWPIDFLTLSIRTRHAHENSRNVTSRPLSPNYAETSEYTVSRYRGTIVPTLFKRWKTRLYSRDFVFVSVLARLAQVCLRRNIFPERLSSRIYLTVCKFVLDNSPVNRHSTWLNHANGKQQFL